MVKKHLDKNPSLQYDYDVDLFSLYDFMPMKHNIFARILNKTKL